MNLSLDLFGIGLVNGCGRGAAAWARGADLVPEPSGMRISRVTPETLSDRVVLKNIRRADRFSKMSTLAAWDAAGPNPQPSSDLGIILTTAYGPHSTTFDFLDDILDFGDAAVSPTKFSHSVHNAAAAYVAIRLECRGPTCTLTDFEHPLRTGLQTAALWLAEDRCRQVLVGYTEELSGPMEWIQTRRWNGTTAASIQPFRLSPYPDAAFSEGSLFLRVGRPGTGGRPCPAVGLRGGSRGAGIDDFAHDDGG